jgi:hypothetical protein
VEEVNRDLTKSVYPTRRVAETHEIGKIHIGEINRVVKRVKWLPAGVPTADPNIERATRLLGQAEVGLAVALAAHDHELNAAKLVDECGLPVLGALEGKTTMSSDFAVRKDFLVGDITKKNN